MKKWGSTLVVVLCIDVEHHTEIHNYPFLCLESDPAEKSISDLQHTKQMFYF